MSSAAERDFANFCCNVAWLRASHGLSKKKMAALLEIGVKSLNKLESGVMPPRMGVSVLFAVQDHFGVHPVKLLTVRLGESEAG